MFDLETENLVEWMKQEKSRTEIRNYINESIFIKIVAYWRNLSQPKKIVHGMLLELNFSPRSKFEFFLFTWQFVWEEFSEPVPIFQYVYIPSIQLRNKVFEENEEIKKNFLFRMYESFCNFLGWRVGFFCYHMALQNRHIFIHDKRRTFEVNNRTSESGSRFSQVIRTRQNGETVDNWMWIIFKWLPFWRRVVVPW